VGSEAKDAGLPVEWVQPSRLIYAISTRWQIAPERGSLKVSWLTYVPRVSITLEDEWEWLVRSGHESPIKLLRITFAKVSAASDVLTKIISYWLWSLCTICRFVLLERGDGHWPSCL